MRTPRVLQISALDAVDEAELVRRIDAVGRLGPEVCARFALQLRDPELDGHAHHRLAERLRARTRRCGVALVVNDRLDVAVAVEADGLHLGRRSVPVGEIRRAVGQRLWISRSVHALGEIADAAAELPDALLLSPIFATPGKGPPLGVAALPAARAILDELPAARRPHLLALGGITPERVASCRQAGADGVAAVRADLTGVLTQP